MLVNVNNQFDTLRLDESAFTRPDDQWEPINIERPDPNLETVIEKIDECILEVQESNGYSVSFPEERSFVLEKLINSSSKLRQALSTSKTYLEEFVVNPLQRLIERHGKAAIGSIATTALDTLKQWLKNKGLELLTELWK